MQDHVAGRVSEGVVVLLEVIEVEHDQGKWGALAFGLGKKEVEVFTESPAVLGAGELVDRGQLGEPLVLAGELLVNLQDAFGNFQPDGQLIRVGRLGEKVVGTGAKPFSRSSRRSRDVSRMM